MEIKEVLHFCTEWAAGSTDKQVLTGLFDNHYGWYFECFESMAKATNQWVASMSQLDPKNRVTNNAKTYL